MVELEAYQTPSLVCYLSKAFRLSHSQRPREAFNTLVQCASQGYEDESYDNPLNASFPSRRAGRN